MIINERIGLFRRSGGGSQAVFQVVGGGYLAAHWLLERLVHSHDCYLLLKTLAAQRIPAVELRYGDKDPLYINKALQLRERVLVPLQHGEDPKMTATQRQQCKG